MVIARYSARIPAIIDGPRPEPRDLLWKALRVAGVCAACAFTFFLLSERNLLRRSGEIVPAAPITAQRVHYTGNHLPNAELAPAADAKTLSPTMESPSIPLPDDKSLKVTEFALSVSPEFQDLDGVQLRLMGLNPAANTYDITVRTRGREFYRQDAKLNEHIALSRRAKNGGELVVGAIAENKVFGYLSEPHRSASHIRARHHRHIRS